MQFLLGIDEIFRKICRPVPADTITDGADVGAVTAPAFSELTPSLHLGAQPSGKNEGILDPFPLLFCLNLIRLELTGSFIKK